MAAPPDETSPDSGEEPEAPRDVDELSRAVADAYFPHNLVPRDARTPVPTHHTLRTLDLGPVLIGYVGWGVDVQIECDYPGAYEVNIPLSGRLESRGRHGTVTSEQGRATVFRADTPTLISHWDAECTVLGVKFDSAWLDREAEHVLDRDLARVSGLLPDQLNLTTVAAREWRRLVGSLASDLSEPGLFSSLPSVQEQLAGALTTGFLLASCPDDGRSTPAQPKSISKVIDALHDDPARAWTVAQLAMLSGMSVRRLQETFRHWLGCSPMDYLVQVRLQQAQADLQNNPSDTVSDIAARWGFSSASRFAAAYRQRYGDAPSNRR
ncbi:AraC-like DNA-binding protein [Pseudonocardia sediminis]|uniref:AraC-like DNA-binding protein n=1 Tax=Pseudonocardia sediminis TaxID=1397368 RepID=A0A4Q7URC9_PSEST|nr:AraC family transcriptional regulator [Pseudonocardia sediminis]RZT83241.1 AraC-like DNA-binding protein [Pseudonocardia sediminis]